MKTFIIFYHLSHISFMKACNTSTEIQAETPQDAVDKILKEETKNGWAVSEIQVFELKEEPEEGWLVNYDSIIEECGVKNG